MDELFKKIMIGEKDVKELDNSCTTTSKKVKHLNEIAKYFLKTSKRKYSDNKLKKRDMDKLLYVYNDLIKENRTIKKYVNAKDDNQDLLKDAEHIIKLFIDDFCKDREKVSIWKSNIKVSKYLEPLLLIITIVLTCIAIIGNLYLMI